MIIPATKSDGRVGLSVSECIFLFIIVYKFDFVGETSHRVVLVVSWKKSCQFPISLLPLATLSQVQQQHEDEFIRASMTNEVPAWSEMQSAHSSPQVLMACSRRLSKRRLRWSFWERQETSKSSIQFQRNEKSLVHVKKLFSTLHRVEVCVRGLLKCKGKKAKKRWTSDTCTSPLLHCELHQQALVFASKLNFILKCCSDTYLKMLKKKS